MKTFEVGGGSGFSRIEYMGGGAMLKPREQAKLGNSDLLQLLFNEPLEEIVGRIIGLTIAW